MTLSSWQTTPRCQVSEAAAVSWPCDQSLPFQESTGVQPFMESSNPAGNGAFRGLTHPKAVSHTCVDVQLG
jgi:hypothetical protein